MDIRGAQSYETLTLILYFIYLICRVVPTPNEKWILVQFLGTSGTFGALPVHHQRVHCPQHPSSRGSTFCHLRLARKVHVSPSRGYSFQVAQGLPIVNLCPASAEQIPTPQPHRVRDNGSIDDLAVTRPIYHTLCKMEQW